ncbi:uncharacterized protein [Antedon mediterranea]|uniref:uncharacterized protein n=1 Tax=Antedon mediterranea TaxID=105859 RepID=UPI003AF4E4DC
MPVRMIPPPMPSNGSSVQMNGARPRERKRLRAWLQEMVDSGHINGLEWINRDSQIIKIPWKHAARHGYSRERDACLFKEWAIHTGKYNPETDRARPKTWKANFRCAINSLPDIVEIKDLGTKRGNNAFKVYKINPKRPKARPKSKIGTEPMTTGQATSLPKPKKPRKPQTSFIPKNITPPITKTQMPWGGTSFDNIKGSWQSSGRPLLLTPPDHQPTTTVYTHDAHPYSPHIAPQHYTQYTDNSWSPPHIKPEQISSRPQEPYNIHTWQENDHDQNSDCSSNLTDEGIIEMTLDMQESSPISSPTLYNDQTDWVPRTCGDKQYHSNELTVTRGMTSPLKVLSAFPTSTSPPAYPIKHEGDSRFFMGSMTVPSVAPAPPPPYRPPNTYTYM